MQMQQDSMNVKNGYLPLPLRLLFYIVFSVLAGFICYHYGLNFYIDSDEANYYLAANEMASGNFILKGWVFSPDNFWLIDVLGMAALIKYCGVGLMAPHLIAALWWAGVTFCALCLANPPQKTWSWVRCLPVVLFIAFPPLYEHRPSGFITFAPYHVGTLFYALCGLIAAQMIYVKKNIVLNYLILSVAALPIFVSDFFGVVFYAIPLFLVSLVFFFKGERNVPLKGIAVVFFLMFIFSEIFKIAVHHDGGFVAKSIHSKFISVENIPHRIVYTFKGLVDFFGVNFSGLKVFNSIPNFIKLVPFLLICIFYKNISKNIKSIKNNFIENYDFITVSMFFGGIVVFFAALISEFGLYKEDIIRYFLPFFVFSILVYSRCGSFKKWIFVIPCVFIIFVYVVTWNKHSSSESPFKDIFGIHHQIDTTSIEEKLNENNLHLGYAGYWEASVVTANSHEKILSRAIRIHEREIQSAASDHDQCLLAPHQWISKSDWYKKSNFENEKQIFFITHVYGEQHDSWLLQEQVISSLGQPDKVILLGDNLAIDVYKSERVLSCHSLYTWESHRKKIAL